MDSVANNRHDNSFGDSLSNAFNFVAKGLFDLALWHYDPGGVALFEAIKEPILSLLDVTGASDALNALAEMLGGGTGQMALDLGGSELNFAGTMDNVFVPDY